MVEIEGGEGEGRWKTGMTWGWCGVVRVCEWMSLSRVAVVGNVWLLMQMNFVFNSRNLFSYRIYLGQFRESILRPEKTEGWVGSGYFDAGYSPGTG